MLTQPFNFCSLSQSRLDLDDGAYGGSTLTSSTLRQVERLPEFHPQRKPSVSNSESEFSNLTSDLGQENVIQEYMRKVSMDDDAVERLLKDTE